MNKNKEISPRHQALLSAFLRDLLAVSGTHYRELKQVAGMGQSTIEKCLSAKRNP